MKAIHISGDTYVVYDDDTRFSTVVNGHELAVRQTELQAKLDADDLRKDDTRLLEWARVMAFPMSWEGQQVEEAERELENVQRMLAALPTPVEKTLEVEAEDGTII